MEDLPIDILVNNENKLPQEYVPNDLVTVEDEYGEHLDENYIICLRKEAFENFKLMQQDAKKEGYNIIVDSGFRSYYYQQKILQDNIENKGQEAYNWVALPGASEHQTGLCFDVAFIRNGVYIEDFENDCSEIKWMHENCYKYGYILRYPEGKSDITGYSYESWHFRYVGKEIAENIVKEGLTLDEYYDKYKTR